MKANALLRLAQERRSCSLDRYACLGDFHGGVLECDHVSPWTKSGGNVDADIMVVGQDWLGADALGQLPDPYLIRFGFDPKLPTNTNLDDLLKRHFKLKRDKCYLTNVFPFIKHGKMSGGVRWRDMKECAKQFTLPEIRIISPSLVICLGQQTFLALMRGAGLKGSPNLDQAIHSPFRLDDTMIHCVAHTGALGMNNRGRPQVETDWRRLAESLAAYRSGH